MEVNTNLITERIYIRLQWKKQTVREASKEIGISPSTFNRLQNGGIPDVITLYKLCNWLRVPMNYFISE